MAILSDLLHALVRPLKISQSSFFGGGGTHGLTSEGVILSGLDYFVILVWPPKMKKKRSGQPSRKSA